MGPMPMAEIARRWIACEISLEALYAQEGWPEWKELVKSNELAALMPKKKSERIGKIVALAALALVLSYVVYQALRLYGISEQWEWALSAPALEATFVQKEQKTSQQIRADQERILRAVNEGYAAGAAYRRENLGMPKAQGVIDRVSTRAAVEAGFIGGAQESFKRAWVRGFEGRPK